MKPIDDIQRFRANLIDELNGAALYEALVVSRLYRVRVCYEGEPVRGIWKTPAARTWSSRRQGRHLRSLNTVCVKHAKHF